MNIQTAVVVTHYVPYEINDSYVYFLKEPPNEVEKTIKLEDRGNWGLTIKRTVYSLEDYIKEQTRELSDFL